MSWILYIFICAFLRMHHNVSGNLPIVHICIDPRCASYFGPRTATSRSTPPPIFIKSQQQAHLGSIHVYNLEYNEVS